MIETTKADMPTRAHALRLANYLLDEKVSVCLEDQPDGTTRVLVESGAQHVLRVYRTITLAARMENRVLIYVRGGNVEEVYADRGCELSVILYDMDNIVAGDEAPSLEEGNVDTLPFNKFDPEA